MAVTDESNALNVLLHQAKHINCRPVLALGFTNPFPSHGQQTLGKRLYGLPQSGF
jgi:hypothetical protein